MKLLEASLNYKTGFLITPFTKIKLLFHKTRTNLNLITISPRCQQVIKIKSSISNGEIIIPHQKIHNCEIPENLTISKNGEAITTILNNTIKPITLNFSEPILVETFDRKDVENIDFNHIEDSTFTNLDISKIRTDHLNHEEKREIIKICKEFIDIFYNENVPLTFTNKIRHKIRTTDQVPIYTKSYRYPFIHRQEVENQIKKMLDQNIIEPSNSPWSSPLWVVPKKADASGKQKWRVVVDYRKLNEKTVDDKYPLPNITDLLDKLGKCQYFTTLDLASGFHQIEMSDESDIEKTAFSTEKGHYAFKRMPFGLKNAPATFQRVMDNVLRGIADEKCLVYLDDIIIFSTSLQEHIERLRCVFQRLRDSKFKIQLDKSEFLRKEVAYLGHIVTPDGVKPNPDKIIAIQNFPIPKTSKQIKSFLGLLGYYRRFINNFSKITKPLTTCLKKGAKIVHNEEFLSSFEQCKNLLINEPILQYPNFSKPFNLTTDASNYALGAILSQGPIGKDLPIAYASRTLNDTELNYSVIEKELLAIVWATKYFRPYLYGRKFNIITDHKPLQWLFSLKDPNSKLYRWRTKLEEFDYSIIYKKGSSNTNADALSRIEIHAKETDTAQNLITKCDNPTINDVNKLFEYITNSHFSKLKNLENESMIVNIDEECPDLNADVIDPQDDVDITVHSNADHHPVASIPIDECPVNYGTNQIFIKHVLHSPAKPKTVILFGKKKRIYLQISNQNFKQDILNFIADHISHDLQYHLYFEDPEIYEPFSLVVQKYFEWPFIKFKKCNTKLLDVTDKKDIHDIIQKYHEGKSNHRGIEETTERIKKTYYWPNLKNAVQLFINNCEICQQSKYDRNPVKIKINVTPTAAKPFEVLHADTFTFEKTKFLTIIDSFSKFAQAYHLNSLTATEIVDNLIKFFSQHGIPRQIIVDNGTEFKNTVVTELLALHKIKVHFTSPHHPQSNGLIERFHSTLSEHLRILNTRGFQKSPIISKMIYAILAYNHTIHSSTKHKPIDVVNGHITPEDPFNLDINKILINDYINTHKEKTKILYSKINSTLTENKNKIVENINHERDNPTLFSPDQTVYIKKHIRQKNANKFSKPTVLQTVDPIRKVVSTTTQPKIHMDNLKRPLKTTNGTN